MNRKASRFLLVSVSLTILVAGCSSGRFVTELPDVQKTPPVLTPSPVGPNTPAPIATLPADRARIQLLALLTNNGDCRLPCLWGITPGRSTAQEAEAILAPLANLADHAKFTPVSGTISLVDVQDDLIIDTTVSFLADPQTASVSVVAFYAQALRRLSEGFELVLDSALFRERTAYYSLSSILTEHGPPESVWISTAARPSSRYSVPGGFEVLLLYPDQGLQIEYEAQLEVVGDNVRGCPGEAAVEMHLHPAGERSAFTPRATICSASMSSPESVSSSMASAGSSTAICRISLRFFSPPEKPSFTERYRNSSFISTRLIRSLTSARKSIASSSDSPRDLRTALSAAFSR